MNKKVTIFGAGAWGTAIAQLLANNGHKVTLWAHNTTIVEEINTHHTNKTYAPQTELHQNIAATADMATALQSANWLVEAIPVAHLRGIFTKLHAINKKPQAPWLLLSKGIEQQTNLLPSKILDEVFGYNLPKAILAGPTFAKELIASAFTTAMLACEDQILLSETQQLLQCPYFKVYPTNDILGVQVGGAVKNVIALAAGLAHGNGGGENMHAFLLTQGFAELALLINLYGGQPATSTGLAGLGDLVLTASSTTSKNYRAGLLLAQGATLATLPQEMATMPEGINTVQSLHQLCTQHNLHLPLCSLVYKCVFNGDSFMDQLRNL